MKNRLLSLLLFVSIICLLLTSCNTTEKPFDDTKFVGLKAEDASRPMAAEVRIMSANVLVRMKSWGGTPVKPRAQLFAEVIKHYQPDVIGLQEFCSDWKKFLPKQISKDYEIIQIKNKSNLFYNNRTPMAYNKRTLTLLQSDMYSYSKKDNSKCRIVTYAKFEVKASGEIFAVTNTHWDFGMDDKKLKYREAQVKELAETVTSLASTGIPVFAVGDFNVYETDKENGAESYTSFINTANIKDSKFEDNIIRKCGEGSTFEEQSWDHIFFCGKTGILSFNILANDFYKEISDHFPIFVDVRLY